jgi:hypothetical protein
LAGGRIVLSQSSIHIESPILGRPDAEADCPPAAFPSRIPRFEPRARTSRGAGRAVGWVAILAVGSGAATAVAWLALELRWLSLLG